MAKNWWENLVTQGYNPPVEPGIDLYEPFHTLITALQGGTIVGESFGGFGARIDVKTDTGITEYYQHLDTIWSGLKVGSKVEVGQALGLSGGQLKGGTRPNDPKNSSGPHIEFGAIQGGKYIDPSVLVAAGPQAPPKPSDGSWLDSLLGGLGAGAGASAGSAASAAGAGAGGLAAIPGEIGDWAGRQAIALFVAAVVLFVLFRE